MLMRRLFMLVVAAGLCCSAGLAKEGPVLHTREQVAPARERCRTDAWAIGIREKAEQDAARWVDMSDEELWDFILDAEIPRALNVRFGVGCPVHGEAVFREGGHYPWLTSSDQPFKVTCPVGGEVYPSNDFEAYLKGGCKETLDTTQPYVDDGNGWVDKNGDRYFFVGYYIFWQRWKADIMGAIDALGKAYELSGDARYAHKLGVMLGRFTEVYPRMDYPTQAYHNGKWPAEINGRIFDYVWENRTIQRVARAYDQVYDAIDEDAALAGFLAERGIKDLKRDFEQKVLHFMARDVMEGRIRGNMYYQPTLAELALVIDNQDPAYGPTTEEMLDWLLYGDGEVGIILHNGFDRDGAGGESAPGYSSTWNDNFCNLADMLVRLGVDIAAEPRWRRIIHFPYNVTVAGKHAPRIGDCGGTILTSEPLISPTVLKFGFKHFKDPQCAQLLVKQNAFGDSLWGDALDRTEVEEVASSAPDLTTFGTRNLGGYGLGVFEAGEGDRRRAGTLYYGSPNAWHGHHDRLTIDYWAHGRTFLPEMGYPAHWNEKGERFTRGMPSHYVVEIDEKRSANHKAPGFLDSFAAGSRVRVMRAHAAKNLYPGVTELYERTLAMIDVGDESFLVDLFRVRGGGLHDYHFHGLPFGAFTTEGLELVSAQERGTLLGEDVAWGEDTTKNSSGYDFFRNVRRYRAGGVWSARWAGRDDCRLAYWMPASPEVIVCDGEPPVKPDYPASMEFVVVRNRASESRFPAVIAPSRDSDVVQSAAFDCREGAAVYEVETCEGTWRVVIQDDGGFEAVLTQGGELIHAFAANKERFACNGKRLRPKDNRRYTITSVDCTSNEVTVDRRIRKPEQLAGAVAVVSGGGNSGSYTATQVEGRAIRFDGPATIGMIIVDDLAGNVVTTSTRLRGYGRQFGSRDLTGIALIGEDMRHPVHIIAVEEAKEEPTRFTLAEPVALPDADNDGRRLAYLTDLAPGYDLSFTRSAEIEGEHAAK